MPNEHIINSLQTMMWDQYEDSPIKDLRYEMFITDQWEKECLQTIINTLESIDDEFFWTARWLIRWAGFAELANIKYIPQVIEKELFKPWKIVRVCGSDKLRTLNAQSRRRNENVRAYIWRHFQVLWYTIDQEQMDKAIPISTTLRNPLLVYLTDAYDNIYVAPQIILVPTTIKDLKAHEYNKLLQATIDEIKNSSKYNIDELTETYQTDLRKFLDTSKKLQQKLDTDFEAQAKEIIEIKLNTKAILEKNEQIASVTYVWWVSLEVITVPLRCRKLPMGRYHIKLDLNEFNLNIINLDVTRGWHNHPHIQASWKCCLWDWVNPMRESHSKWDYITLIACIISYLEDVYDQSVYRSMNDFQNDNAANFKYQIKSTSKADEAQLISTKDIITSEVEDLTVEDAFSPIFSIGDRVIVLNDNDDWHEAGTIGTVIEVSRVPSELEGRIYNYKVNAWWITKHHGERNLNIVVIDQAEQPTNPDSVPQITFEIWDPVVVINNNDAWHPEWTLWVITGMIEPWVYQIEHNQTTRAHHAINLSPYPYVNG